VLGDGDGIPDPHGSMMAYYNLVADMLQMEAEQFCDKYLTRAEK